MSGNYKLICLFGMPRSGTTWIGKIFDSHPDTLYMHEPDSWRWINNLPLFPEEDYSGDGVLELKKSIADFPKIVNAQVTSKLPIFKKNYQVFARFYAYKASLYFSSICHKYGVSKKINPIKRVSSATDNSFSLVWKSIESLGRLPLIAKKLDDVYCIHIVRNPAGYISSVINGERNRLFQEAIPSSDDYDLFQMLIGTKEGEKLGYFLSDLKKLEPIERLAIRWRIYNEIAYENSKALKNYKVLIYEDLCRNPVEKAQEIFRFCGLVWNAQTASFVNESVSQNKNAYYSVYKDPLDAANKWRSKLGRDDINKIYNILHGSIPFSWFADEFEGLDI